MSSHIAAPRAPGAAAVPELGGSYRAFLDGLRAVAVWIAHIIVKPRGASAGTAPTAPDSAHPDPGKHQALGRLTGLTCSHLSKTV